MFDCSKDLVAFHDKEVTLPQGERTEMKQRRDSNRKRLLNGLAKAGKPMPLEFKSQGSYAMKTMVQDPDKNYDIDDGVYFAKEDLVGPRGGHMSSLEARTMVRDALDDGSFKTPPEVRKHCVRVYYEAGYHVDVPVYRRVTETDALGNVAAVYHELASSTWIRSDARDVTAWFEAQNNIQSPDEDNGRQMRRMVRDTKSFARSRHSWIGRTLSGFAITKLITECYAPNADREDRAFYDTLVEMHSRLEKDLVIEHPCTEGATITRGDEDPKAVFFKEKLADAIANLAVLFEPGCTRTAALKAWDKVFNTTFFSERDTSTRGVAAAAAPSILSAGMLRANAEAAMAREPVRKEGDRRYA